MGVKRHYLSPLIIVWRGNKRVNLVPMAVAVYLEAVRVLSLFFPLFISVRHSVFSLCMSVIYR